MAIKISAELSHICPPEEIPLHARQMEASGFFRIWIPDTAVSPWEVWLACSVVAHHTRIISIGLGVTNPYTRHPFVVAQSSAYMQFLSEGRLSLCLGRGIQRFHEKAGIRQHPAALEEFIKVLRGLLSGQRTTFSGQAFRIDALRLRTPPIELGIPIYMAAVGESSWDTAVEVADGISTFWSPNTMAFHRLALAKRRIPTAVLVPFSQGRAGFFAEGAKSVSELKEKAELAEQEGFDELIVAYGDLSDLRYAARLIRE